MRYSSILFDLDGTLTDPMLGITKSVQYALSKFDVKIDDHKSLIHFIGPPLLDSFIDTFNFTESQGKQAVEYYREYFSDQGIFENNMYPGIENLLIDLTDSGANLMVATSKPTYFATQILSYFKIDRFFSEVIGSNMDGTRSSKTAIISHIINSFSLNENQTVMIGDRKHDLIGAKNCNINSIGVTYGYGSREELEEHNPTFIIESVDDLSVALV